MSYLVDDCGTVYEADLEIDEATRKALDAGDPGDLAVYQFLGSRDGSWICVTAHDPRTDPFLCNLVAGAGA